MHMANRGYEAEYIVQRVAGRSVAHAPVPFTVFLVSRAVEGRLDPHRPPVYHKVSAAPLDPGAAVGRPLGELRRFVLSSRSSVPPEFAHVLADAHDALFVVELEAPPGSSFVPVVRSGALAWLLRRRVSRLAEECFDLGDWAPVPTETPGTQLTGQTAR